MGYYLFIGLGILLLLGIGAMALFSYLADRYIQRSSRKALKKIDASSQYKRKNPPPIRTDKDYLAKDKVAEKKKQEELETGVSKYNPREQDLTQSQEEVKIVGVVEPEGFWSEFVTKQKIGFILAMGMEDSKKGYWVNFIKAQSASQGKDQTRGR